MCWNRSKSIAPSGENSIPSFLSKCCCSAGWGPISPVLILPRELTTRCHGKLDSGGRLCNAQPTVRAPRGFPVNAAIWP